MGVSIGFCERDSLAAAARTDDPVHWVPMEPSTTPRPPFAHASEAEFARILDFYEVRWEYEPHVFPILWNLDGLVVESFSPDFWLPDLELYVELTTLKQSLVRKKNRKLRRLRELYPGIRIKLFYGRDFRALMLKYGKHGLISAMSGTPGQSTPPRPPIALADPVILALTAAASTAALPSTDRPPKVRRSIEPALALALPAAPSEAGAAVPPPAPPTRRRPRRRRAARPAQTTVAPVTTDG
jgi:hypothetical protein